MTSRLNLYQKSIKKFIINQSILENHSMKDNFNDLMENDDFILPITTLTIMNGQHKKNSIETSHGYDAATGIELLFILFKIFEYDKKIETNAIYNISQQLKNILIPLSLTITNQSIVRNINMIEQYEKNVHLGSSDDINSKSNKINKRSCLFCMNYANMKIQKILENINSVGAKISDTKSDTKIKHLQTSEFKNYHFTDKALCEKLPNIKIIPKDKLLYYIENSYGELSRIAIILGWVLGGSSIDMINNLERIGYHLGFLIKLSSDFSNIEKDINNCISNNTTFNYIINYGLQNAFEFFDDSKKKFIEGLLALHISSNTIREFINVLESKVNNAIELSSPDIKLTSSSTL